MALGKFLILRKLRGCCLEGRTAPIRQIRVSCSAYPQRALRYATP